MFYSDRPITSSNEDQLNRGGFAKQLAQTLMNLNIEDTFTVGLYGKWGSGKTSIVNMTLAEIEKAQSNIGNGPKTVVVRFEPWNFTDTNQLLTQFFVRLSNELQQKGDDSLKKIGKALENYSDAFDLLGLIPSVGSYLATLGKMGVACFEKKIPKDIKECDVLQQKDQVVELLRKQPNRILVVIDDIDRLSNEQIRYIFQLITSVAKFPNTTYLLAFDEEVVVDALKGVQNGNGQEYLEKVIQMPIQVPNIQRSALHSILFKRLDEIINDFTELRFSKEHWQQMFEPCVDPYIKHLRDINRLCNVLRFKLTSTSSEIDFADMVSISILEIYHPLIYKWVINNKTILTSGYDFFTLGEKKSQKEWLSFYSDILQELVRKEQPEGTSNDETMLVIKLLSSLFPSFGQKVGMSRISLDLEQFRRNNQIAHPDKFDRYFELNIDNLAYRTADVNNIISEMAEEKIVEFLLFQDQRGASYQLLEDIKAHISELSEDRAIILIRALLRATAQLNQPVQKEFTTVRSGNHAELMVVDLFERVPTAERKDFMTQLISDADMEMLQSIAFIINLIEWGYGRLDADGIESSFGKVITLNELLDIEKIFSDKTKSLLETNSLFDFSKWGRVFCLLESFEPNFTKSYLQTAFVNDENVLQFIDRFVDIYTGHNKLYEVKENYTAYFSEERAIEAIEACRQNATFFMLSGELQQKCAAFFLTVACNERRRGKIPQEEVEKIIADWERHE